MQHAVKYIVPLALLTIATVGVGSPAAAATHSIVSATSAISAASGRPIVCPGLICQGFWKTNRKLVLRKAP